MQQGEEQQYIDMGNAAEAEAMADMNARAESENQELNFDDYLFHPSSGGDIMTDAKNKSDLLGETCKNKLLECWIEAKYGRKKDITNKYMEKGTQQEDESITLYSRVTKRFHKKNTETIRNKFLVGTPDLFEGDAIMKATEIIDIKTSWDIFTFYQVFHKPINKNYFWQLQGYMDITGAKSAKLVYCLVDTPENLINDAKRKLQWTMGVIDPSAQSLNSEYHLQCLQIEKNMTFDDIPMKDRYIEFNFERDQAAIDKMHEKIILCREFMNSLNLK